MKIVLLIGGTRSGKSRLALEMAEAMEGPLCYIATAEARDEEMKQRIEAHRRQRSWRWKTIEEPLDLKGAIKRAAEEGFRVALVDCLTLWLSNLLERYGTEGVWAQIDKTMDFFKDLNNRDMVLIIVTNEVGLGVVPENALARAFRDMAGSLNQALARLADEVHFVVAGLPMKIK
jgi:adenosylcobinamide kinase/adenosylcobinamide-phosphate guanylyltransferase